MLRTRLGIWGLLGSLWYILYTPSIKYVVIKRYYLLNDPHNTELSSH